MNIGIDIDNVISNFNNSLLDEFLKHDKKIRNKGIINKHADYISRGMFDWTKKEIDDFYYNNIERIAQNLDLIPEAKEYIDKIKDSGNNIYIITGRDNGNYSNPYKMTEDWLKKHDIYYDKLILTNSYNHSEKAKVCIKYNIDIMIDDSIRTCEYCIKNNITTLLMNTDYNKNSDIVRVNSWKEIYEYILNYKVKNYSK